MASWKFAPALAAGNTVVLKPASETPLTALLFARDLRRGGPPGGRLQRGAGPGATAGAALVAHPGVDKISFTGATGSGKRIMRAAADTVKRVSLELGGKSPNIVFADADLDAAVRGAPERHLLRQGRGLRGGLRGCWSTQACTTSWSSSSPSGQKTLLPGDPLDKKTRLGRARLEAAAGDACCVRREREARRARSSSRAARRATVNGKGYFFEATVFDGVTPEMTIAREEIFGPVLAVLDFDDEERGRRARQPVDLRPRRRRLDPRRRQGAPRGPRHPRRHGLDQHLQPLRPGRPFGGYKESGFGRELGRTALEEYTETKTVWIAL